VINSAQSTGFGRKIMRAGMAFGRHLKSEWSKSEISKSMRKSFLQL